MQTIDLEMSKDLSDIFFNPRASSLFRAPAAGQPAVPAKDSRWMPLPSRGSLEKKPPGLAYEPLLNDSEAARFLGGLHPKTVQRMARRGEVPHYRVGKYYRYRASELDAWLDSKVHSAGQKNPPAHTRKET